MNIKINKLTLQNFKGIKFLEINADGENLNIYGDNATGKTTVFDAFTWLLFGKDSLGRSDFGIKTQDENGNAIHYLDHSVECELAVDNSILTLKKVYAEKWTKKRGSAEAEFSGHETKYFANEVPTTKKEYEQKIADIIDENLFKIITNPLYFNEHMKWQDRRAILLNLCNHLSDEELIARSEEFAPLLTELKGRTVQEYSKIVKSQQTAINDELKVIPQRISEASLAIPVTVAEVDETERAIIQQKVDDLNDEILSIRSGAGSTDGESELRALKAKKNLIETSRCDVSALDNDLFEVNIKIRNTERKISSCRQEIATLNYHIEDYTKKADSLRQEWHEVSAKQYTDSEMCPTCGQKLPDEQIANAKAKFNTDRAEKLDAITEKGKQAKAEIERMERLRIEEAEKIDNLQKESNKYTAEVDRLTKAIETAKAEFDKIKHEELAQLNERIAEAVKMALNSTDDVQSKIYPIQEQINAEKAKLAEIDKAIAEREIAEKQKKRIAELEAEEKRLAGEYANLDAIAFLIDKFTKYKVDLLGEEINSHFKYARFKLFVEQINMGISECCEATVNGVPYSDLNTAARINAGLDIINTLSSVKGKTAPIFLDNRESCTSILPTQSQVINLFVSASDKKLRIEKA